RRQHHDVRLFETGSRFSLSGERRGVAGVWAGAGTPPHWSGGARPADFYDVKGVVETIGRALGVELECEPRDTPFLVPGTSATVSFRLKAETTGAVPSDSIVTKDPVAAAFRRNAGVIGQIAPGVAEARGFPANEPLW